jgi:hypothetical protein
MSTVRDLFTTLPSTCIRFLYIDQRPNKAQSKEKESFAFPACQKQKEGNGAD